MASVNSCQYNDGDAKAVIGYILIGLFVGISRLIYVYNKKGGFTSLDAFEAFALGGICWPAMVPIAVLYWFLVKVGQYENRNKGYLMRKPTPEEIETKKKAKFEQDVLKVIK